MATSSKTTRSPPILQTSLALVAGVCSWFGLSWVLWGADPGSLLFMASVGPGTLASAAGYLSNPKGPAVLRWTCLVSFGIVVSSAILGWLLGLA